MDIENKQLDYEVWNAISMTWTEIGLDDSEYPEIAKTIKKIEPSWDKINDIIVNDVCASFAVDTILVIPFWMMMPDWGYSEKYLLKRIEKWQSKPRWFWFLNPIRIIGYPISLLISYSVRRKLKQAYFDV